MNVKPSESGTELNESVADYLKRLSREQKKVLLTNLVVELDELITTFVRHIVTHDRFQSLESGWLGLKMLAEQIGRSGDKNIELKIFDATKRELLKNYRSAAYLERSRLFQLLHDEAYSTAGGKPFNVVLGDFYFDVHKDNGADVELLEYLSSTGSKSFTPFISGVSAESFRLTDFYDLPSLKNIDALFSGSGYSAWRTFRAKPESKFIGLVLPKVVFREPFYTSSGRTGHYSDDYSNHKKAALWGNGCYVIGLNLLRCFKETGWFGHLKGETTSANSNGTCKEYAHIQRSDSGLRYISGGSNLECALTDETERLLSNHGFISLQSTSGFNGWITNYSLQSPYMSSKQEGENVLSAMLQHVFCACRIAHFIKVFFRDKVGSYASIQNCQQDMEEWLASITDGSSADNAQQAKYPLAGYAITIKEAIGQPGIYTCSLMIKPQFQVDYTTSEINLLTNLKLTQQA